VVFFKAVREGDDIKLRSFDIKDLQDLVAACEARNAPIPPSQHFVGQTTCLFDCEWPDEDSEVDPEYNPDEE